MFTNKKFFFFFSLVIALSLFGCEGKKSVLLSDPICKYPCWQDIYPGKTTFAQAVAILSSNSSISSNGFSPTPAQIVENYGYSSWTFKANFQETALTIYNIGDIVEILEFSIGRNKSVGSMIENYGEPEHISVISGTADSRWLEVNFLYPSKGIMIEIFESSWKPDGNYAQINSDMKVFHVYYFDPSNYELLIKKGILLHFDYVTILNSIQDWKGYGLFSFVEE